MINVQVTTEVEVDEQLIIDQNEVEWEDYSEHYGPDPVGFIEHLLETNWLTVEDLGQVTFRHFSAL